MYHHRLIRLHAKQYYWPEDHKRDLDYTLFYGLPFVTYFIMVYLAFSVYGALWAFLIY